MRNKLFVLSISVIFSILVLTNCSSQIVGKIFTKEEANTLYGTVLESVTMDPKELNSIVGQSQDVVMFKLANRQLTILGDGRKVLSPAGKTVEPQEVYSFFSKSKVVELLSTGSGNLVVFENRQNHLTITYGASTLEEAWPCPPYCP